MRVHKKNGWNIKMYKKELKGSDPREIFNRKKVFFVFFCWIVGLCDS